MVVISHLRLDTARKIRVAAIFSTGFMFVYLYRCEDLADHMGS